MCYMKNYSLYLTLILVSASNSLEFSGCVKGMQTQKKFPVLCRVEGEEIQCRRFWLMGC